MSGQCWNANGQPKRRFDTRAEAKAAAARYRVEFPGAGLDTVKPYRCHICDYFHLGHYPTSEGARAYLRSRHVGRLA